MLPSSSQLLPFFITDNFIRTYKSLISLTTVPAVYVLYRIILNISLLLTIESQLNHLFCPRFLPGSEGMGGTKSALGLW